MPSSRPVKRRKLRHSPKNYPIIPVTCCSNTESAQSSDVFSSTESTPSSDSESTQTKSTWTNDLCSYTKSTQSSDVTKEMTRIKNLKDNTSTCDKVSLDINGSSRRQMMSETGGEVETKSPMAVKMPSEAELEEFFTAAEKQINKQFRDKYNFDVAKEMPLQGRYEWVKIIP